MKTERVMDVVTCLMSFVIYAFLGVLIASPEMQMNLRDVAGAAYAVSTADRLTVQPDGTSGTVSLDIVGSPGNTGVIFGAADTKMSWSEEYNPGHCLMIWGVDEDPLGAKCPYGSGFTYSAFDTTLVDNELGRMRKFLADEKLKYAKTSWEGWTQASPPNYNCWTVGEEIALAEGDVQAAISYSNGDRAYVVGRLDHIWHTHVPCLP